MVSSISVKDDNRKQGAKMGIQSKVIGQRVVELTGEGCAWKALVKATCKKTGNVRWFIGTEREVKSILGLYWSVISV